MTRKTLILLGIGLPIMVGSAAIYACWPQSTVNRGNYDRIQLGMPLADVAGILGSRGRKLSDAEWSWNDDEHARPASCRGWYSNYEGIYVYCAR
jgi:hypothetical protein